MNGLDLDAANSSAEDESSAEDVSPEFCDFLFEKGPCHGRWKRYWYDSDNNTCKEFVYGGCDGNENNFHTKTMCETVCAKPNVSEAEELLSKVRKRGEFINVRHSDCI